MVLCLIGRNARQPRLIAARRAVVPVYPCGEEGLLCKILGQRVVTHELAAYGVHQPFILAYQHCEFLLRHRAAPRACPLSTRAPVRAGAFYMRAGCGTGALPLRRAARTFPPCTYVTARAAPFLQHFAKKCGTPALPGRCQNSRGRRFLPRPCEQMACLQKRAPGSYSPPRRLATNQPAANVTMPAHNISTENPPQSVFSKMATGEAEIRPMMA